MPRPFNLHDHLESVNPSNIFFPKILIQTAQVPELGLLGCAKIRTKSSNPLSRVHERHRRQI